MKTEIGVKHPAPIGGVLFLATVPIHMALPQDVSIVVAAITLALIGGAYIGFGARSDTYQKMTIELVTACLFGLMALAGILWHWSAIPIGLSLHAIWDLLHHNPKFGAAIPHWYIPLCVVYDLAAALFLVIIYAI